MGPSREISVLIEFHRGPPRDNRTIQTAHSLTVMHSIVALRAERDQVFLGIGSRMAAELPKRGAFATSSVV